MTTTDDPTTLDAPPARQRRTRRSADETSPAPRRTRRPQPSGEDLVAQFSAMVDRLIAENRDLKRALARAERAAGDGLGQAARALSGLQRRVSRALASGPGGGRRGRGAAAEPAVARRPRRKVTDPEVLERRRAALAKARAARAAKREAGG